MKLYFVGSDKNKASKTFPYTSRAEAEDVAYNSNDPDSVGPTPIFVLNINADDMVKLDDTIG